MAKVKIINKNVNSDLIGQNFQNIASETIFNFGNFRLTTNFTGKQTIDYTNEISSFATPITLETLNVDENLSNIILNFTTNTKLNLDNSDLKSYVRFGSTRELLRVAIEQIIEKYPASLFFDSQMIANGATTVQNYSFNPLTNMCEFIASNLYIVNTFGLVYDAGNNSVPNDNNLKNLNISYSKYNVWRADNPLNETHTILGYTGDSSGSQYIRVRAFGNPFPELSATTSGSISFHIKPQPIEYNRFKLNLSQLEEYLLNNRLEDRSGFAIKFKEPSVQETGQIVYTAREYLWSTYDGYNVEINTSTYQRFFEGLLNLGNLYDETKTDLIARFLTPESLKLYDLTEEGKITKLLRIYGSEFDQIRAFIDGIVTINKTTYNKKNNIPDQLVKNLAKTLGWNPFVLIDEKQFTDSFFNIESEDTVEDLLPSEVDIELWRRIIINTNYFWRSKGTRNSLESMLLLIGIPETFINITEYIYTVEGRIDPNTVTFTLEDLPSASLPYDSNGYPISPVENNNFYFQISGNADSGQAYIDLYRQVGFTVNRVIDNKKSWAYSGFTQRVDDTTPNYYQQDSKLILNTKEIDATLDIAQAIEYDVFCYNKNVDEQFTTTGITIPYLYINIPFDYGFSANTFTTPDIPLTGSSVQVNFNGITLTSGGTGFGDYIVTGTTYKTVVLNEEIAQTYSNGDKDIITITYLHNVLGTTGFTDVQYIIQQPTIISGGTIIDLVTEPKGDVQLIVDGISLTKQTELVEGDFYINPNDKTKIIVFNPELQAYLLTNPILKIWRIDDGVTPSTAEKKSEVFRVDSLSSKVQYNGVTNQYSYILDYRAFDVETIKITLNGLTLQNKTDFTLDPFNDKRILFRVGVTINYGDIIGAYYLLSTGAFSPPLLPPDSTFPSINEMTFLEYLELIRRRLINVKNRKTISDFNGGYHPTVQNIYEEYIRRSLRPINDPLHSSGYSFAKLYPFIEKYNSFFNRFITQLLPATIITRKAGVLIRNTSFTRQKFMYRRGVNFDQELQYLGDNGAEYVKRVPVSDCGWTNDYVCVTAITTTTTTLSPTTTTTTTVSATTTTTTTVAPTTTTTTTAIMGIPAPFTTGMTFNTLNTSHTYPSFIIDFGASFSGTSTTVLDPYGDTPNRFSIKKYSDNSVVVDSNWVGDASYAGPWGVSLSNPQDASYPLVLTERYYIFEVETVTGPTFTDNWNWNIPAGV